MGFKRSYVNKAMSVTMLFMLLLVHSIKLLHGHNGYFSNVHKSNVVDLTNNDHPSSTDCGICSYQLNKDADDVVFVAGGGMEQARDILNESKSSCYTASLFSFFESRGPPACL